MGNYTLKVPAEHVEAFRLAVLQEITMDAGAIAEEPESLARCIEEDRARTGVDDDLRRMAEQLREDVSVLEQVGIGTVGELEVSASTGMLAHAVETMGRKIVGPELANALDIGPWDGDHPDTLRELIGALSWALEQAQTFHASAIADLKEEVAGA